MADSLTPLFDGNLTVTIGGVDVTSALLPGLRYTTTAPGGFGECSMRLPAASPFGTYHAAVVQDADVDISHSSQVLFRGKVMNDLSRATISDGEAYYDVAGAGLYNVAGLAEDFCRVYQDTDLGQWFLSPTASKKYETDTDGRLAICAGKTAATGDPFDAGRGASFIYWLNNGLGNPSDTIDHITLNLADYRGTGNGMDLAVSSSWVVRFQTSDSPWGTWTKSRYFTADGGADDYGGPLAAGTALRIPAAGSMPAGTQAVRMLFLPTSDATPTADRFVAIKNITVVSAGTGADRVDEIMWDIASDTGLAAHNDTTSIGSDLTCDVSFRPYTTRAEALEQAASLHTDAFNWGFWYNGTDGHTFETAAITATPAWWYAIDASTPGVTYDIHSQQEGQPDYIRILFKASEAIGSIPPGYVCDYYYPSDPGWTDATKRVAVLDMSDVSLTQAQAGNVALQYHKWIGSNANIGTITVRTPTISRAGSITTPTTTAYVRAGEYILEATHNQKLFISGTEYEVDNATLTITIGETAEEFKYRFSKFRRPAGVAGVGQNKGHIMALDKLGGIPR
jgi:hypothetical protein